MDAIFSRHPNKSPGIDGMSPIFFQKFWPIVKTDVIASMKSLFHSGLLCKDFNMTLISLIPKIENPTLVSHFRPISLCNVCYKIISKILSNRLKSVLNQCISTIQSAFVPGR